MDTKRRTGIWRWGVLLGLCVALVALPAWGNLTGIEAGRFTVRGCEGLFLKIATNAGAGKRIQITIGTNQITFPTDDRGRVETGCLAIPSGATEAKVELLDPVDKAWPVCCTIPLSEVPKDRYARVPSCQDLAPPRTTLTADPGPNRHGWNNTPVAVRLSSADDKSGTVKLCYTLSGAFTQAERCLTFSPEARCGVAPAPAETSITVNREGVTAVSWYGVDAWGNREATRTAEVRIDMTKPTLTYTLEPKPNEHGWNNTEVRVVFQAHDALSGLEAQVPDQVVPTEGKDQSVTATATDKAGNTTPLTVRGINIDRTKPTVQLGEPRGTRGNAGWYVSDVTVPYTATDNLSGFAPDGRLSTSGSRTTSEDGRAVYLPVTVSDRAGNTGEARAGPFMIDRTRPRIRLDPRSEPGKVVVSWEVSDATSGVDTGSCTVSVSGPGITGVGGWRTLSRDCYGQVELRYEEYGAGTFTVRVYARDVAGNEASSEVSAEVSQPQVGILVVDNNCRWASRALEGLGYSFTQMTQGEFARASASDLRRYKVIVVGWSGDCDSPDLSGLRASTHAMAEAVDGRVVLSFQDPDWHHVSDSRADDRDRAGRLLRNMIEWVSAGRGTGLIALADPKGKWDWTPWAHYLVGNVYTEDVEDVVVRTAHPVYGGLDSAAVSNWGKSRHGYLTVDLPGFEVIATAGDSWKRVTLVREAVR